MLWLWGSERASEVTGARDGSAYGGSLTKLTEAVEFESPTGDEKTHQKRAGLARSVSYAEATNANYGICLLTLVPLAEHPRRNYSAARLEVLVWILLNIMTPTGTASRPKQLH